MSGVADWSEDVKTGKLLDRSKPTLCVSSQGAGAIKIANFLASVVGFEEVVDREVICLPCDLKFRCLR